MGPTNPPNGPHIGPHIGPNWGLSVSGSPIHGTPINCEILHHTLLCYLILYCIVIGYALLYHTSPYNSFSCNGDSILYCCITYYLKQWAPFNPIILYHTFTRCYYMLYFYHASIFYHLSFHSLLPYDITSSTLPYYISYHIIMLYHLSFH